MLRAEDIPWWSIPLVCAGIGAGLRAVVWLISPPTRCEDCGTVLSPESIPLLHPWVCDRCRLKRQKIPLAELPAGEPEYDLPDLTDDQAQSEREEPKDPSPAPDKEQQQAPHGLIRWRCSACGKSLKIDKRHVGKRGKCPKCGVRVEIPSWWLSGG
jgi:DNA-directed RNA polymerase subunit RPC12/RpoP